MAEGEDKGFFEKGYERVLASVTPTRASDIERRLGNDGQSLKLDIIPALKAYANEHDVAALKNLPKYDDIATVLAYEGTGYDQSGKMGSSASSAYTSAKGGDFSGAGKAIAGNGLWDSWNSISTSMSTFFTAGLTYLAGYFTEENPRSFMAIWNQEYAQSLAFSEADAVTERLKSAKLGLSDVQVEALADFTFHRAMARYKDEYPTIDTNIARRDSDTSFITTASGTATTLAGAFGAKLGLTSDEPDAAKTDDKPKGEGEGKDKATPPASTTKIDVAKDAPEFLGTNADYASLSVFTGFDRNNKPVARLEDVQMAAAGLLPLLPSYNYLSQADSEHPVLLNLDALREVAKNPDGKYASLYTKIKDIARQNLIDTAAKNGGKESPDQAQVKAEADAIIQDTIAFYDKKRNAKRIMIGKEVEGSFTPFESAPHMPLALTLNMLDSDARVQAWSAGHIASESLQMSETAYKADVAAAGITAFRSNTAPEEIAKGGKNVDNISIPAFLPAVALPAEIIAYSEFLKENNTAITASISRAQDLPRLLRQTQLSTSEALQIYRQIAGLSSEKIDVLKEDVYIRELIDDPKLAALAKKSPAEIGDELNNTTEFQIARLTTGDARKAFESAGIDLTAIKVPDGFADARSKITVAQAKMLIGLDENGLLNNFTANGVTKLEFIEDLQNEIKGKDDGMYIDAKIITASSFSTYLNMAKDSIFDKLNELEKFKAQYADKPVAALESETPAVGLPTAIAAADDVTRTLADAQTGRAARLAMDRTRVKAAVAARTGETDVAQAAVSIADTDEVVALNTPTGQIPASSGPSITT